MCPITRNKLKNMQHCPQHKHPHTLMLVLAGNTITTKSSTAPLAIFVQCVNFALFVFDTKHYSFLAFNASNSQCFHIFVLLHLTFFDTGVLTLTINIHTSINITWQSSLRHIQARFEVFQSTTKHNVSLFCGSSHCTTIYLHHV